MERGTSTCALNIKNNTAKLQLQAGKDGHAQLKIRLSLTAGLLDYSKALPLNDGADTGDVPSGVFYAAEQKLTSEILSVFEKSRACGCDLFGLKEQLQKYKYRLYDELKDEVLHNAIVDVSVRFQSVR